MALLLLLGIVAAPLSAAQLALSRPEGDCLAPAITTTSFNFFPSSYQLQSILAPSASSSGLETTVSASCVQETCVRAFPAVLAVASLCRTNAAIHTCSILLCILVILTPLCLAVVLGFLQVEFASDFTVTYYGTYKVHAMPRLCSVTSTAISLLSGHYQQMHAARDCQAVV
jgi:hypothetical protein